MQDRFKFRAWNKNENEYIYDVEQIAIPDIMEDFVTLFRIVLRGTSDNLTLEQCTGLKDKNGKLIYEGDIVEAYDYTTEHSQIVWDKGCYVLKSKDAAIYEHLSNYEKQCAIIGNIHENPELLEEK